MGPIDKILIFPPSGPNLFFIGEEDPWIDAILDEETGLMIMGLDQLGQMLGYRNFYCGQGVNGLNRFDSLFKFSLIEVSPEK